jgi:hypothetical protein
MQLAIITLENKDEALSLMIQEGEHFRTRMSLRYHEDIFKALQLDLKEQGYAFVGTLHFGLYAGIDQWIYSK